MMMFTTCLLLAIATGTHDEHDKAKKIHTNTLNISAHAPSYMLSTFFEGMSEDQQKQQLEVAREVYKELKNLYRKFALPKRICRKCTPCVNTNKKNCRRCNIFTERNTPQDQINFIRTTLKKALAERRKICSPYPHGFLEYVSKTNLTKMPTQPEDKTKIELARKVESAHKKCAAIARKIKPSYIAIRDRIAEEPKPLKECGHGEPDSTGDTFQARSSQDKEVGYSQTFCSVHKNCKKIQYKCMFCCTPANIVCPIKFALPRMGEPGFNNSDVRYTRFCTPCHEIQQDSAQSYLTGNTSLRFPECKKGCLFGDHPPNGSSYYGAKATVGICEEKMFKILDQTEKDQRKEKVPGRPQAGTEKNRNVVTAVKKLQQESDSVAAASSAASAPTATEKQNVLSGIGLAKECLAEMDELFKETARGSDSERSSLIDLPNGFWDIGQINKTMEQMPESDIVKRKRHKRRMGKTQAKENANTMKKLDRLLSSGPTSSECLAAADRRRLAEDLEAPHDLFAIFPIMIFLMLALFIFRQPLRRFFAEKSKSSCRTDELRIEFELSQLATL